MGGDLEGLPLWYEVADLDAEVPASLPNRTYLDSDEAEQVHTWNTYYAGQWSPVEHDGKWYPPAQDVWDGGRLHDLSVVLGSGLTHKTLAEYQAISSDSSG